jgi:uncharacterized protein
MTAVFADSSFYLALVNVRDGLHGAAVESARSFRDKSYTSEYVLSEVGNWLGRSGDKQVFVHLVEDLQADADTIIVPGDHSLFLSALDLYARRLDKDWSFIDCSSFVLMNNLGLTDALTADHHFAQAGFRTLL